ncbi:hypothetical protein [Glycomyces sp. YM15]|uniref:hypothetical protein n=1 Tax=Glycomyces sp. YM15 TaxID=2800446 RepID=UPI001963627A|nr:hypothetical protein [Glycomyces sp. YM15]
MTVLGTFEFGDWVIEVESMKSLWGLVLYCKRVDVDPPVPVAERGVGGLRVTSWIDIDELEFKRVLLDFLAVTPIDIGT